MPPPAVHQLIITDLQQSMNFLGLHANNRRSPIHQQAKALLAEISAAPYAIQSAQGVRMLERVQFLAGYMAGLQGEPL
jgi:hypothetical protein